MGNARKQIFPPTEDDIVKAAPDDDNSQMAETVAEQVVRLENSLYHLSDSLSALAIVLEPIRSIGLDAKSAKLKPGPAGDPLPTSLLLRLQLSVNEVAKLRNQVDHLNSTLVLGQF